MHVFCHRSWDLYKGSGIRSHHRNKKDLELCFNDINEFDEPHPIRKRSAIVEWLKRLDYGAESRREEVSSNPSFAIRRTEKFCLASGKWEPISNQGRIVLRKKKNGLRLSYVLPKICTTLNPSAPTAIRQWETIYLVHSG